MNWKEYYNKNNVEYEINYVGPEGNVIPGKVDFEIMMYPQVAVNTLLTNTLSELPLLSINNERYDFGDYNLFRKALSETLAYGKIIVEPYLVDSEVRYNTYYTKDSDVDYEIENGELVYFSYKVKVGEDTFTHIYNQEGQYIIENDKNGKQEITEIGEMICFLLENNTNVKNGLPIYADCLGEISQLNKIDYELSVDRQLSRKTILVPNTMLDQSKRSDASKVPYLNAHDNKFVLVPGIEGERQEIKYLDGDFKPEKYTSDRDYFLHLFSIKCGFGNKYLCYNNSSGNKTAYEVASSLTELMQTKKNFDKVFRKLILGLINAQQILNNEAEVEVDIFFQDNLNEDDGTKRDRLLREFQAGAISQEYYLKTALGLSDEEIKVIVDSTRSVDPFTALANS